MDNLADLFYYDETSPSGLRHKVDKHNRGKRIVSRAGDIAGCLGKIHGYWQLRCNNKTYLVHRIIVAITKNLAIELHGLCVDHINGIRHDNRESNLRLGTRSNNAQNTKKSKANSSGITGVGFNYHNQKTSVVAAWTNEVRGSKSFSVRKFGLLPAFAMAVQFREAKIAELNANGANYTDRHGT